MASKVEELQCYQLADQLRREVIAICAQKRVTERRRFCDGFTEAAGSVCRNIREGFARYESGPIVQFFRYALASLEEVKDYLCECSEREFIDQKRLTVDLDLVEHTKATMLRFMRFHEAKRKRKTKKPSPARST
jgi:four helix bundle protein